jgi:hypothetical protein
MYRPQTAGERVATVQGRRGIFTGKTGRYDEHYVIELDSGETIRVHYEDLTQLRGGEEHS